MSETYTTEYISGVMSLRKPQRESLMILDEIMRRTSPKKHMDLDSALSAVSSLYPTCKSFEREFMSLTFALATGVGKTRLMGAFIAYLYTNCGMKNYFVVAPNTTIYEKLKRDISETGSEKYIFRGLGCFAVPPRVYTEDDYRSRQFSFDDVNIFVYNIDKFNKEGATMRKANEILGNSFYEYISQLEDLVLIMDESHHYRAERGALALNELHPVLGLELTATPRANKGSRQVDFMNVVYDYPLWRAIRDGYTRTPYAVTRTDIEAYNFGKDELDRRMLDDGITCHERTKQALAQYSSDTGKRKVKPFVLVVCKDTEHAERVREYVCSDSFRDGVYRDRTIIIHSGMKGAETEENTRLLLDVESAENPVEIVIHVNMLKEGWDVNNLYTIVPLRTAASKILREQMIGRGLRLPFGERTGRSEIDAVMLTAHDKFSEIIEEAQRGDSIFRAENVIDIREIEQEKTASVQLTLHIENEDAYEYTHLTKSPANDKLISRAKELITEKITDAVQERDITPELAENIAHEVSSELARDYAETYREHEPLFASWVADTTKRKAVEAGENYIPIPKIKITDSGMSEYVFADFELDMSAFHYAPIESEILIRSLTDPEDIRRIIGNVIDFDGYNPHGVIMSLLREKPEIDYARDGALMHKLTKSLCAHYEAVYGAGGMRNVIMMNKRGITEKIFEQMMMHLRRKEGFLPPEEVLPPERRNIKPKYNYTRKVNLYEDFTGDIHSVLFTGIRRGVFDSAKFDSREGELTFARVIDSDSGVMKWLRPSPREFNITYDSGRNYEPDFVVETESRIYLVEVKGENIIGTSDVEAKTKRGVQYCDAVSRWGKINGYKEWRYLFIPSAEIHNNSSFGQLTKKFTI